MRWPTNNSLSSVPLSSVSVSAPSAVLSPVLRKGQVVTGYYRWLQRRGGYLWIQSTATVSINHKAPHERNVIWVNYVLRWVQSRRSSTLSSDMRAVNVCRHHAGSRKPLKRQMMKSGRIFWRNFFLFFFLPLPPRCEETDECSSEM